MNPNPTQDLIDTLLRIPHFIQAVMAFLEGASYLNLFLLFSFFGSLTLIVHTIFHLLILEPARAKKNKRSARRR